MWIARLKNGLEATEMTHMWKDVKNDISTLSYVYNGTKIDLPPLNGRIKGYIQYKSGSASLLGGVVDVDSQTVGFILENGVKVLLRFYLKTNKIETIIE